MRVLKNMRDYARIAARVNDMREPLGYRRPLPETQPRYLHPAYVSTVDRAPLAAPIEIPATLSEVTGPSFESVALGPHTGDLTAGFHGEPIGERIVVAGRVLDQDDKPVSNTLIEVWQCNAAGRYRHAGDQHAAPLDPNFTGVGRVRTDDAGIYQLRTIKPGAYPWRNHHNAWRPAHIHFSLFGSAWSTRLITQMYFPGDPLLALDPIYNSIPDLAARERLIASLDWEHAVAEVAIGYRFDIVLRGRYETPSERRP
jgi:protocatechuate 3,4-dioxygenase beta subunit